MKKVILLIMFALVMSVGFTAPFGLEMGMTLNEIKAKCGGEEPVYEGIGFIYKINPIKKDGIFTDYSACVHDNLGLFAVFAFTDFMSRERCEVVLNHVLSALKGYYGEPSESSEFFYDWDVDECEKLKKEKLKTISLRFKYGDYGYRMDRFML